jgi:DNA-binding beta-propeller fold protein YncE
MTTGHGLPTGKLWKIELGADTVVGRPIFLGTFPASIDVTPDGLYLFAVNFNLHGAHVPSTVSTIFARDLIEVAQTVTCTMPHGSRVHPAGRVAYSACMMDDRLVELDTRTFAVARQFSLAKGSEGPFVESTMDHAAHEMAPPSCSPTWAQPSAAGTHVYVACNSGDEILEISLRDWRLERRWATGRGPYNLAVTPDGGLLVATLKQGAAVEVFDLASGRSRARMATSAPVANGVVVSPDGRYAFVSVENVGMAPGKVDIFDLDSLKRVASVEVGQQASGIDFWRLDPSPGR